MTTGSPKPRKGRSLSPPAASAGASLWIRIGTLIDGESQSPARDAHIVYDAECIRFVGTNGQMPPTELLRAGQSQPDLHAPDATLLPGLIEAHAHLFLEGGELGFGTRANYLKHAPESLLGFARGRLEKLVRLGVIGVRDAGDKDGVGLALSRLYANLRRRPLMPYLDSPGAAIHHQGRYGSFMGEPLEDHPTPHDCVAARVAAGADRIKLIPTGIINFKKGAVTSRPQMSPAEVSALVAAARSFRRQTFAHASGDDGIESAIEGGVDSVEHGFFVRSDQLARMRDRKIAWVPTFAPVWMQIHHASRFGWDETVVGNLRRILDQHAAALCQAHEMGVVLVAGSDAGSCGVAHGLGLLDELELMESAGLPPIDVIRSATGNPAGRLAFHEKFGRIAPGYLSRFILTRHSPLEGVRQLRKARTIVFDDKVFETDEPVDVSGL